MLKTAQVSEILAAEARSGNRRRVILIAVGAVVILAIAAGGWAWWSSSFRPPQAAFTTEAARLGDIHVTLVATGTLQPTSQIAVSTTLSGTIASVDADYNDVVKAGDVLAQLDLGDLQARLRRASAMVDVQSANRSAALTGLSDSEAALRRITALSSGDLVSPKDLEQAESAVKRAQATLSTAEAQLKAAEADLFGAQNDLDKGTIRSPIDGVVLTVGIEPGQIISAASMGTALFTIAADLRDLNLEADIDEADVAQIAVGDHTKFTVEAFPDRPFDGVIQQVRLAPVNRDGVVNYRAIIAVKNDDLALMPGMTVTAEIATGDATGVLTVPNAALRFIPAGQEQTVGTSDHVFVPDAAGPRMVTVETGLTDGLRSEIVGGLREGDLVITGTGTK